MTLAPTLRRACTVIAVVLLLALAWLGISGGVTQWRDATRPMERLQYVSQVAYGVFALLMLVAASRRLRWQSVADAGFIISAMAAASLATVVWGGGSIAAAMLSALGSLLVAGIIVWILRVGRRV
jgi:hypothetical protein